MRINGIEAYAPEFANGGGGFKPEYFAKLAQLESENFWFKARNELILWALQKYSQAPEKFLEVGCGTGFVLSSIARSCPTISLSASEIFIEGLLYAVGRVPAASFMQMDARKMPFVNEFDVIGAFDVLEHIEDDKSVLLQAYKALKSSGVLILTVPQHPWLWSAADEYACHVRRYTRAGIEEKVTEAGFKLLESTSFVFTLLPAMMISRLLQKKNEELFDSSAELKIPPLLNKLFYSFMSAENQLIKAGFKLPIGGSRLIVARK